MSIFKACDIRGRYGAELTPDIAHQLGLALGTELNGMAAVVGGDLRPSTGPLRAAMIEGLVGAGCHVLDVGILPTPAFYFAKDTLAAPGGVMVTGSHNPADDNGFKISLSSMPISEGELASLKRRVESRDYVRGTGNYTQIAVLDRYLAHILSEFSRGGGQKVVVDPGNGCYAGIAPELLGDLGYQVVAFNNEPDGRFPGRDPNPSIPANLRALCQTVVQRGADLGLAFDGDGDRVVFVDERGRVVDSERVIVLFARYLLRPGPAAVVYDLKCSSVVEEEVRRLGGSPVMERSGHAFIKTALLRRKAVLGGEISGHFFFGALGRDDGLYAALLLLQILAEEGRSLATLAETVPRYPITPDIRRRCPPEEARAIVEELEATFAGEAGCRVSTLDGVRITWPDGWALVRPSVTEPLVTLRFEAHHQARLAQIQEMVIARSARLKRVF